MSNFDFRWFLEWLAAIALTMIFVLFASSWVGLMLLIWKRILT